MTDKQKIEAIRQLITNRANSYGYIEDALDIANEIIKAIEGVIDND